MNQEEDSADYQIYPFSLSEQEKTDKFMDEEEDNQLLKSLNISYQNYRRQDEETVNSLSLTTEPDEQLDKTRYFTEPDVRWGYDNKHIKDKWEMTKTNQQLFEPTDMSSSPHYSPTTSQVKTNEIFLNQKNEYQTNNSWTKEEDTKNIRQSRDNDLFTEPEEYTPWIAKTEHEGLLNFENQPQTNPTKLDGIAEWPTPTTTKEVESFLGSENFDTEPTQNDEDSIKPQNRQDKDEQDNRDMVILPTELFLNLLNHKFDNERTFKNDDEQFDPIKTLSVHEPKSLHNQISKVATATSVNDVMTVKVIDMDLLKQKTMAQHRDITINDMIDTLLGKKPDLWKDESKNWRIWIPQPPKNTTLTNHSTLQQSRTIQILNGKQARQSLFLSERPNRYTDTDNHNRILLPGETAIEKFDKSIVLLPWNLRTPWKRENNLLFCIAAFNFGIPPAPLLIDLLESLGSGMVMEDQGSTERVISRILRISEPYNDGTTEIPDKSISDRKPQLASHKFEQPFDLNQPRKRLIILGRIELPNG